LIYLFRRVVLGDLDLWVTLTSGSLVLMTQAEEGWLPENGRWSAWTGWCSWNTI